MLNVDASNSLEAMELAVMIPGSHASIRLLAGFGSGSSRQYLPNKGAVARRQKASHELTVL